MRPAILKRLEGRSGQHGTFLAVLCQAIHRSLVGKVFLIVLPAIMLGWAASPSGQVSRKPGLCGQSRRTWDDFGGEGPPMR